MGGGITWQANVSVYYDGAMEMFFSMGSVLKPIHHDIFWFNGFGPDSLQGFHARVRGAEWGAFPVSGPSLPVSPRAAVLVAKKLSQVE